MSNIKTMLLRYDITVKWKTKATPNDYFFTNNTNLLKLRDLFQKVLWSFRLLLLSCIIIIKYTKICIFFNYWNFFHKKKLTHAKKKVFHLLKTKILFHRRLKVQLSGKYLVLKRIRALTQTIFANALANLKLVSNSVVVSFCSWFCTKEVSIWSQFYQETQRVFSQTNNKKKFRKGLYNLKFIKTLSTVQKQAFVLPKAQQSSLKKVLYLKKVLTKKKTKKIAINLLPRVTSDIYIGFKTSINYNFSGLCNLVNSLLLSHRANTRHKSRLYMLKQIFYTISHPTGYDRDDTIEYGAMLNIFEVNKPSTLYFSEFVKDTLTALKRTNDRKLLLLLQALVPHLTFFTTTVKTYNILKSINTWASSLTNILRIKQKQSSLFFVEKKRKKPLTPRKPTVRVVLPKKTMSTFNTKKSRTIAAKKSRTPNIHYLISKRKVNYTSAVLGTKTNLVPFNCLQLLINNKLFPSFKKSLNFTSCRNNVSIVKKVKKKKKKIYLKITQKQVLKSPVLLFYINNIVRQKQRSSLLFLRAFFLSNTFTSIKSSMLNRVDTFVSHRPSSHRKLSVLNLSILKEFERYNFNSNLRQTFVYMRNRLKRMTSKTSYTNTLKVNSFEKKKKSSEYVYSDILKIKRTLLGLALKRVISPLISRNVVFYGRPLLRLKSAPFLLLYTWQVTVSLPRTYTARLFFYRDLSNIIICTTLLRCSSLLSFYLARLLEQIPRHSWFFHIFTRIMSVFKFYCTAPISLKVLIKGRVNKKLRKHSVCLLRTQVAMSQLTSSIDYSLTHSFTNASLLGIKVWVVSFSKAAFVKTFAQRYKTY